MDIIWQYLQSWLIYGALSAFAIGAPWVLDRVRATHWFESQRPLVKWLITVGGSQALRLILPRVLLARTVYQTDLKIAVKEEVQGLMPEADRVRNQYPDRDIPWHKGNELKSAAVQSALEKVAKETPEIFKAIPPRKVQGVIANAVDPAVKKERKRRKVNPNQKGGAGAHP